MTAEIIKEILKIVPKDKISDAVFEAANIVLYSKDRSFLQDDGGTIRAAVSKVKKRIELRPDPSLCAKIEDAKTLFKQIIPEEAGLGNIIFDPQRSMVFIEADHPGVVIGKNAETIHEIKQKTFWVPQIKRNPPIRSKIIENIREVLYENTDYRRKFLNRVGERVYNGWLRSRKESWVRLTYLGGGRQVGRSAILLQTPESRILLDCGIDPAAGTTSAAYPHLEAPEFRIEELDAVIITHAHMDHVGFLPYLFKYGYKGPVYCTEPTRDIMALLQLDTVKIMMGDGKSPLYTSDEVREVVKHSIAIDYETVTDVTPDVRITFYNSGHILGGAMCHINIGNGLHNMLYTGDIKFVNTGLLQKAHTRFPRLETLLVEGTYGAKDNILPSVKEQDKTVSDMILRTFERGGKILIPTLGTGRGQEIIIIIDRMIKKGLLPEDIPVYIHGMVWDINAIYTAYPEFMLPSVRNMIVHKDDNPFLRPNIKQVGSNKEKQEILQDPKPCIILATSGMLVGGPSVDYLRRLCEDERNTLLFSCYQPEDSLGRRILSGEKEIDFSDKYTHKQEIYHIRMEVSKLEISAHADRRELVQFITRCQPKPRRILINHGEKGRLMDLASSIHKTCRVETLVPRNLDSVRIR